MRNAFVFPGQGAQKPGMGAEMAAAFPVARQLFQEVDDALNQHLFRLMTEGPEEELTLTENAQPALMAASLAVVRVLESEGNLPLPRMAALAAGHSLGEYSALAAAGALTVADAARLLKLRGRAMQSAVPVGRGAMLALIGLDIDAAEAVASEAALDQVCVAANDNAPGQVVLSGDKAAVARAGDLALGAGARRAVPLAVSAPFHCPLMQPAAAAMAEALAQITLSAPSVPLIANVTAAPVSDPDMIRDLLVRQVCGRVRWRESVLRMKELGVTHLVEPGTGNVLTGLARRIDKGMTAQALNTPQDVEAFLEKL